MNARMTVEEYEHAREKLRDLETRMAALESRSDLGPEHLADVRQSYRMMMREFLRDIRLFETHRQNDDPLSAH